MLIQTKMAGSDIFSGYKIGGISDFLNKKYDAKHEEKNTVDLQNLFRKHNDAGRIQKKERKELDDERTADYSIASESVNRGETEGLKNTAIVVGAKRKQTESANSIVPGRKRQRENRRKEKTSSESESPERLDRTLFVGNIPLTSTRKELKSYFTTYGRVQSVRLRSVPVVAPKRSRKLAVVKKEFHAERSSMNAYVVFKDKIDAERALEAKGSSFKGMHLRVDMAVKKEVNNKLSVFVGNLPFNIQEEDLREHFTQCGDVDDVRIIRDKQTGVGKGFGYVAFKKKECVGFAIKLQNSELKGRKIRVFKAVDKKEANRPFNKKKDRQYRLKDVTSKGKNPVKGQKSMKPGSKKNSTSTTKKTQKISQKSNSKGSARFKLNKGKGKHRK